MNATKQYLTGPIQLLHTLLLPREPDNHNIFSLIIIIIIIIVD